VYLRGPSGQLLLSRLRRALLFALIVLIYATVTGLGSVQALLAGPAALMVAFALIFDSSQPGSPLEIALRWAAGLAGLVILLGALGLVVGAAYIFVAGQQSGSSMGMEWLLLIMAVPLSLGVGVSGYVLLMMGATGRGKKRHEIDVEQARNSDAVLRFDASYGPGSTKA
jgi:hypothetical protein